MTEAQKCRKQGGVNEVEDEREERRGCGWSRSAACGHIVAAAGRHAPGPEDSSVTDPLSPLFAYVFRAAILALAPQDVIQSHSQGGWLSQAQRRWLGQAVRG